MSFGGYDDSSAWGPGADVGEDLVRDALRKDALLKEIAAAQEDLKAMLGRVTAVQGDVDKLKSGNETLQLYIDNLTMQMAKRG